MQRYYIDEFDEFISLSKEDSHHVKNVMRNKVSDKLEIVIKEELYLYEIVDISNVVKLKLIEKLKAKEHLANVVIAQALINDQKISYVFQKGAELGAKEFIIFPARRSVTKLKEPNKKELRWMKILKEASGQSKRLTIPKLQILDNLNYLKNIDADLKILCTVNEKDKLIKNILNTFQKDDRIVIVIGPEGGFDPEEEKALINAGYISTSLGALVLRTETASTYVLSIINYLMME